MVAAYLTGNNYVVYVVCRSPLRQVLLNSIHVPDVEKTAIGTAEKPGEVLNGIAFGGGVNNAEHLLHVVLQ
jgi:hypothetical protein